MVKTVVVCTEHGKMDLDWEHLVWICTGWAGEGCLTGMIVTLEQVVTEEPLPGSRYERTAA